MISIIVPAYNEEKAIKNVLLRLVSVADAAFKDYEIVVVDDGSTDNTQQMIKACQTKKMTLLTHPENMGYGKSLLDGIEAARYNCIGIIDADATYPVDDLPKLFSYYPGYDMVVGARFGKEFRKGVIKRPARSVFQFLVEYACGRKIPDVNSGMRIFKKDLVLQFKPFLCGGFSFTTTLTLIFSLNKYYIKFVPVQMNKREGTSKVRHFYDTLRTAQIIVEAILFYNPIKLFLLLGTLNILFGIALAVGNYFIFRVKLLSIIASICIASFMPIFCVGLLAFLLTKLYRRSNA
ncbi:MAG: glycosyltransferase family 2 protein [Candidatus Omnitrophota bacterium]